MTHSFPTRRSSELAVIGCVVNGPGEAKEAHVGLTGGSPNNLVYIDGKPAQKLNNENLVDELEQLIRRKAAERSEEHTSEHQSLMRISYAVVCLKKTNDIKVQCSRQ